MKVLTDVNMNGQLAAPRFSLVRGGFFYRLERRVGLIDKGGLGISKRIGLFWCLTWLPIVLLEWLWSSLHLFDLRMNIRFLLVGPLMIAAELPVDLRLDRCLGEFRKRGIVADSAHLNEIIFESNRTISGPTGIRIELVLFVLSFAIALAGDETHSFAGGFQWAASWYRWIAMPLFQFLQLRWIWRYAVWAGLLWKISRLRLSLLPAHPDLAGGLGMLAFAQISFALLWIALSTGASSVVAFKILNNGIPFQSFYPTIAALVGIEALLLLAPLAFFVPALAAARRKGLLEYGELSSRYVSQFDRKWIAGASSAQSEPLLGTSDIQSLADLGNGFERVKKMRLFPAGKRAISGIVLVGLLPFLPLLLMVVRIEDVLRAAVKLLL